MTLYLIGIFLVCSFVSCRSRSTSSTSNETEIKTHTVEENPFEGLRNIALGATPEKLGILFSMDTTTVYGVVMDWGVSGAVATTVSYQTGDASFYLSSGGAIIGGGAHENVSRSAKHFVNLAQTYLDKATKTETTRLPVTDEVKFYLLTNHGIFVGQEQMKNIENGSSEWLKLFEEGNKVLTEIRLTTGNKL